jgi:hypothetical protein
MDDLVVQIEAQYCPPLDPALVSAILLDYDVENAEDLAAARRTLDELKEDAILNEAVAFDPSGTGAVDQDPISNDHTESHVGTSASQSRETDSTSLTNDISALDFDDGLTESASEDETREKVTDFDQLDEATKIRRLQRIFRELSRYTIQHTLRKYNGKWDAAVDDLLSQAALLNADGLSAEDLVVAKGIDGFSEQHHLQRGRKGKARNRKPRNPNERRSSSLPGLHEASRADTKNTWKTAAEDINFIASRTGMSTAHISSIYYSKGASVSQTIGAVLGSLFEDRTTSRVDDAIVVTQATELKHDFPTISMDYLQALIKITYPSRDAAHELAKALVSKPSTTDAGGIRIIPQFAPLDGVDGNTSWNEITRKARSATSSRSTSLDVASSAARKDAYAQAQAIAYSKAGAAHRKARSDRLMGGAAAYYGQLGREYAALSSSAAAETADRLVASQSMSNELDLHGVDVANAVRIAREKVAAWWDRLGENRVNGRTGAEERLAGYRIVVGLGKHSEGGRSKLGPAVTKMLKQEGWRVESLGAVVTVKGRLVR